MATPAPKAATERKPPAQRAEGQPRGSQPPRRDHGHDGAAEDHDVGVADEGRELDRHESGEAGPGAPPGTGLGCQHRPQQEPGTGRDQRGVGERRHVVAPGERQRRSG